MELYKTILMYDKLPQRRLARYQTKQPTPKLTYLTDSESIREEVGYEETLVLTTPKETNWEKVLLDLLMKSAKPTPEDKEIPYEIMASAFFVEQEVICTNVIKHPSNKYTPIMDDLNVYESEFCPKNSIFFLPPAQFLGVFPETHNKEERGMAILNSNFVFHVECSD